MLHKVTWLFESISPSFRCLFIPISYNLYTPFSDLLLDDGHMLLKKICLSLVSCVSSEHTDSWAIIWGPGQLEIFISYFCFLKSNQKQPKYHIKGLTSSSFEFLKIRLAIPLCCGFPYHLWFPLINVPSFQLSQWLSEDLKAEVVRKPSCLCRFSILDSSSFFFLNQKP